MSSLQTQTKSVSVTGARIGTGAQALMAVLLGVFLVGTAGFSHMEIVHNAGHDTRHSSGFPCH